MEKYFIIVENLYILNMAFGLFSLFVGIGQSGSPASFDDKKTGTPLNIQGATRFVNISTCLRSKHGPIQVC